MDKTLRQYEDQRHSYNRRRQHRTIEMVLGMNYKFASWKRWCREVSTVENEEQHTPQAHCQTMCIRRGNVNNIFCEL